MSEPQPHADAAAATAEPTPLLADDEVTELLVALLVADWRRRHPAPREDR
jgi:hypothetical protein